MRDDASSSRGSEFSGETPSSTAPLIRRGLGRGRRPTAVPSVTDSGLATASSLEASVGDANSVRSRADKESVSEAFTDADEYLTCTEDEQLDVPNHFSNINCLFFKELQKNSFKVHRYIAKFSPELSSKDKRQFFLKKVVISELGETLLDPPDVLYTSKPIAPDKLSFKSTLHDEEVVLECHPSEEFRKLDFFSCFLKRVSLYLTAPQAFFALNLLSHQNRFEVYPGDVLDVAERELVVRCSPNFNFNLGRVSDIIEECFVYSAIWRVDEATHHEIVERNLHELVVLNESDNKSYAVEKILWDENSRREIPYLRCRRLKKDMSVRLRPEALVVTGSRRKPTPAADRGSYGGDKTVSFVGEPATGQQRQLALIRYEEIVRQERSQNYLKEWGIFLHETAVVSNGVVLQTDVLKLEDNTYNLATTHGWTERLSNLRVRVPVRIKNWYVIFEKGDERLVDDMVAILKGDAPRIGIEMKEPRKRAIAEMTASSYERTLNTCLKLHPNTELFMVVVRWNRTDIYNAVKRWSLGQENPIVTQVIMRDTANQIRGMLEYSFSVITQINCKLGGALWALDKTVDNTMVIGLSMYTSSQGKDVLGFVSSRNKLFTQWYSYAIMERNAELREQLRIAIKKYSLENANVPPKRIIVLSNQIEDENLPREIESNLRAVFGGNLTLVHVEDVARYNKMVYDLAVNGKISELKTMQKKYLFVPQRAGRELDMICCRLDSNDPGLSPKDIAGVIKQLKHVYYNVAGEVNLPAPVLYAERCAEFVSDVLDGQQNERIRDKLYYL